MGYIKTLPLPPPRCRSVPHQLPPASAVCTHGGGIFLAEGNRIWYNATV